MTQHFFSFFPILYRIKYLTINLKIGCRPLHNDEMYESGGGLSWDIFPVIYFLQVGYPW